MSGALRTEDAPAVVAPAPSRGRLLPTTHSGLAGRLMDPRWLPFALAAVTVVVFLPVLRNSFVEWDDSVNLFENPSYRGLGWKQIQWMFTNTLMGHYIPVTWLTFGLDYTLWGMNPLGYHLTNLLLHGANAALFYLVAFRLLSKATTLSASALCLASATAALFFALHPLRAESVAWATERRDVLSGLFFLLTVVLYLTAVEAEGRRRHRFIAASLSAYTLALLSKSIVMTLPAVLVLLDVYPLGRVQLRRVVWRGASARAALKEKLPYLALGLAGAIASYWAVAINDFVIPLGHYGWTDRMAVTAHSVWFYLEKTVMPVSLSPLYERPASVNPLEPRFLLSGVAVVAISALLLTLHRRWPAGLAVWAYYGIILGPVSGIVQSGPQLAHDRYSYLSCLGWALLAGAAVGGLAKAVSMGAVKSWIAGAAGAVAVGWILTLGTLTWYQVQAWRDSETLWRHALESDPGCSICQGNLGSALYHRKLYHLARERFETALTLRPDRLRPHGGLGIVLASLGDFQAAMQHLSIAVAHYPNDPDILTNMGVGLADQKRYSEAMPYLERATRINPNHVPGLVTLGNVLIETGRSAQALEYLLRALPLRADEPVLRYDLARAYLALSQYEAARNQYETLVKLDPERARDIAPEFVSAR
jgi:protein O-mannosyl-transferase